MAYCSEDNDVYSAEAQLSRGQLQDAYSSAIEALKHVEARDMLGRAYSVLIQVDFQSNRLTDLTATMQQSGHQFQQLPATVILLWGVVAIELGAIDRAQEVLSKYTAQCTQSTGISREDAMALSRLYAVQLLGNCCHDFAAAASWLESGGAGLSHEQQELLFLELEEAEEVLQEERLAEWAATHSVEAASPVPRETAVAAAEIEDTKTTVTDFSTQHSARLMASASLDLSPADASSRLGSAGSGLSEQDVSGQPDGNDVQQIQQQVIDQDVAANQTSVAQHHQFVTVTGQLEPECSASAVAVCKQQQPVQRPDKLSTESQDDNAFCTMTGLVEDLEETKDVDGSAAVVASPAAGDGSAAGAVMADSTSSGGNRHSRDQGDTSPAKMATAAATPAAVEIVKLEAQQNNSDISNSMILTSAPTSNQQEQQQDSLLQWMGRRVSSAWHSQTMQGTLEALNLQDLQPWELAGGLGLAVLLGFSVYRKRRTIKRAAADLTAGVVQTAQMALGMTVNPMSVVPNTGHMLR